MQIRIDERSGMTHSLTHTRTNSNHHQQQQQQKPQPQQMKKSDVKLRK